MKPVDKRIKDAVLRIREKEAERERDRSLEAERRKREAAVAQRLSHLLAMPWGNVR